MGECEGGRSAVRPRRNSTGVQAGTPGPGGREGNIKEKTMGNIKEKLRGRQTSVKSVKNDRTGEDVQKSDPHPADGNEKQ